MVGFAFPEKFIATATLELRSRSNLLQIGSLSKEETYSNSNESSRQRVSPSVRIAVGLNGEKHEQAAVAADDNLVGSSCIRAEPAHGLTDGGGMWASERSI